MDGPRCCDASRRNSGADVRSGCTVFERTQIVSEARVMCRLNHTGLVPANVAVRTAVDRGVHSVLKIYCTSCAGLPLYHDNDET